jgi:hypothetical protein
VERLQRLLDPHRHDDEHPGGRHDDRSLRSPGGALPPPAPPLSVVPSVGTGFLSGPWPGRRSQAQTQPFLSGPPLPNDLGATVTDLQAPDSLWTPPETKKKKKKKEKRKMTAP